jgi:mRNA-degrading endonuclease RelE of RelBE toxin-antitoxin system
MSHFDQLPEFQKELKRLGAKYPSLYSDLKRFEVILETYPTGIGKNFNIIHYSDSVKVVKARLACKSLKGRTMRVIYAYHNNIFTFVYIEIYFKGDKENENRERIEQHLKTISLQN